MHLSTTGDVRLDTVATLQQYLKYNPESAILDRAIDLALSPRRVATDSGLLLRNVLRDARILDGRRRRREMLDPLDGSTHLAIGLEYGACPQLVTNLSPEAIVDAHFLEAEIRRQLDAEGCGCLDCMLAGDSVADTAARLGASTRHVKRLRARVRELASIALSREAA